MWFIEAINSINGVVGILSFALSIWLGLKKPEDRRPSIAFFGIAVLAVLGILYWPPKQTPKPEGAIVIGNGTPQEGRGSANLPKTEKPFIRDTTEKPTVVDTPVLAAMVSNLTPALEPIANSAEGFRIEIKACYLDRQNLRCPVLVTNLLAVDHCLSIRAGGGGRVIRNSTDPSSVRDDNDNEFKATTITRGNRMSTGEFDVKFSAHDSSLLLLDFQVGPVKMKVLKKLDLICNLCDWSHGFPFSLEQVPVLRQAWKP